MNNYQLSQGIPRFPRPHIHERVSPGLSPLLPDLIRMERDARRHGTTIYRHHPPPLPPRDESPPPPPVPRQPPPAIPSDATVYIVADENDPVLGASAAADTADGSPLVTSGDVAPATPEMPAPDIPEKKARKASKAPKVPKAPPAPPPPVAPEAPTVPASWAIPGFGISDPDKPSDVAVKTPEYVELQQQAHREGGLVDTASLGPSDSLGIGIDVDKLVEIAKEGLPDVYRTKVEATGDGNVKPEHQEAVDNLTEDYIYALRPAEIWNVISRHNKNLNAHLDIYSAFSHMMAASAGSDKWVEDMIKYFVDTPILRRKISPRVIGLVFHDFNRWYKGDDEKILAAIAQGMNPPTTVNDMIKAGNPQAMLKHSDPTPEQPRSSKSSNPLMDAFTDKMAKIAEANHHSDDEESDDEEWD